MGHASSGGWQVQVLGLRETGERLYMACPLGRGMAWLGVTFLQEGFCSSCPA